MSSSACRLLLWLACVPGILQNPARAVAEPAPPPSDGPARQFRASSVADATAWQLESRRLLARALRLEDLLAPRQGGLATSSLPFDARELGRIRLKRYERLELELNSTSTRRIRVILTLPVRAASDVRHPAVVCIHGHGGNRAIVYDTGNLYRGFAHALAGAGYVTISTDVGQHTVYETNRTLMGERLWDVMRCVDYLASRPQVDASRIGCAGLSLGGEMAMWLGAMDDRVQAVVSSGFLTTVANLRQGHCPCWDFPGLTENFDFSDIYSLIAPRALLCQVGELEMPNGGFPVEIAEPAMRRIRTAYAVWNAADRAVLDVPDVGHVFVLERPLPFLASQLRPESP